MRKTLALLATVGAFMLLTVGIASAQQYPGTTTTSTTPGTETITPTTVPPATAPPTTAPGVGAEGVGILPATGSESLPLAQVAIVLMAAGGIALLAMRRQAEARTD